MNKKLTDLEKTNLLCKSLKKIAYLNNVCEIDFCLDYIVFELKSDYTKNVIKVKFDYIKDIYIINYKYFDTLVIKNNISDVIHFILLNDFKYINEKVQNEININNGGC